MTRPPDLAALIAQLVDERVDARLAELGIVGAVVEYSAQHLPPRTSRRAFLSACRTGRVVGARRDGRGWTCSRSAWDAYRARGPAKPVRGIAARGATDTTADVVDIDAMLRAAGLRQTVRQGEPRGSPPGHRLRKATGTPGRTGDAG